MSGDYRNPPQPRTFYIKVFAFHPHGIGNLTFTGSNLIYVTNANKTEESVPVPDHNCIQHNLFQIMDNITNTIDETHGKYEICFWTLIYLF